MNARRLASVAAASTLLLLASCAGGSAAGSDDTAASGTPVEGGRLVFATNVEPNCLDVGTSPADITAVVGRNLFDTLLAQAPDGSIHPALATSYEVNPDVTSFTFHLRDGVTFSDGTPLDAAAVKYNFDRAVAPETASLYASSLLGPYKSTTVVDPLTLQVDFTKPFAPFLQAVTQGFLGIQSPTAITSGKNPCTDPVGSGPFTLASFTPGDSIVLDKRADYQWGPSTAAHEGPAYLDELVFKVVPEDQVRVGLLANGEVDAVGVVPPLEIANLEGQGYKVISAESQGAPYSLYLNTSKAPFDQLKAREAFRDALDIDGIVKTVYLDRYARAWGPLAPATPAYDAGVENSWKSDPEKANALLDDLGWTERNSEGIRVKDGQPLTADFLSFSGTREQRNEVATLVQAQLAEVGIKYNIANLPVAELFKLHTANDYEVGETSWVSGDPDVLRTVFSSTKISNGKNFGTNQGRVNDPKVDQLIDEGAASLDIADRAAPYAELQQYLVDQVYSIPIYVPSYYVALDHGVGGVTFGAQTDVRFYDAWVTQ